MQITQPQLLRAVPEIKKADADEFVAGFNEFAAYFGIDTPARVTHFVSQMCHESGRFAARTENLNYSADGLLRTFPKYFPTRQLAEAYARKPEKIASRVYANRMGNGSEASGDGWRYRGRGYIGLTGKSNYADFNRYDMCVEDIVGNPDKVATFPLCIICALWFWERHRLNALADEDDGGRKGKWVVENITRKINGGTNGLSDRIFLYNRFKKQFGL